MEVDNQEVPRLMHVQFSGTDPSCATQSHIDAIGRFLADQEQRPLLGLSSIVQSAAEAEAAARARMLTKLHAFEQQFESGQEPEAS